MRSRPARGWYALAFVASQALWAAPGCNSKFEFDVPAQSTGGAGGAGTNEAGRGGNVMAGSSGAAGGSAESGAGGFAGATPDDACGALPRCPPALHCAEGACHECVVDDDCASSGSSRCDPERHRCVACLTDQDCSVGFACDSLANRCLRTCGDGLSCPPDLHGCDEGRGVCYECDEDRECEGAAAGELCASDGSGCVQCRSDTDCRNQRCDPLSGRCVDCRDGRDCDTGLCDPSLHTCLAN